MTTDAQRPSEQDLEDFRGSQFQTDHVTVDAERELAQLVFVLDFQELQPSVARLRDWALAALAPQSGEVAVDVGCGTGAEVRRIAALVGPDGRSVGVEPHAGLRTTAVQRAAGTTADFVDGDATHLPFEDASVDVLRCERVYQHLADPQAAADEVARVLRPGGRAVILDSDWGTAVTHPGDPDVVGRYRASMNGRIANPYSGRLLRTQLQKAGLVVDPDIGSQALVFPDEMTSNPIIVRTNAAEAVKEGVLTQAEAEQLEADIVTATARGEAFVSVTMYAVVGRKPA